MLDPMSVATAVLSTFHVLYLTARFIYREVLRAKGFHDGRARMAQKYRLEIVRLRAFWTVLTRNVGRTTDVHSFKGLSGACQVSYLTRESVLTWQ
jgi:hypothetical protein